MKSVVVQNPYAMQPNNTTKRKKIFGDDIADIENIVRMKSFRK